MNARSASLSKKEGQLLKLMGRVGFYIDSYKGEAKVSQYAISRCLKKKLIKKESNVMLFTNHIRVFTLTSKGKNILKTIYGIDPYKGKRNQIEHDFVLGKIYLGLTESERESWKTETTLSLLYPGASVSDALYVNDKNELIGVEVITKRYTNSMISGKKRFIDSVCDKALIVDTRMI